MALLYTSICWATQDSPHCEVLIKNEFSLNSSTNPEPQSVFGYYFFPYPFTLLILNTDFENY